MSIFDIFKFKIDRDRFKNQGAYKATADLIDGINFHKLKNEEVLLEQSRKNFELIRNSVEYIEKKADELLRYLGVGAGAVGILLNYSVRHMPLFYKLILLAGFIFWVTSIILALSIRKPSAYPYPAPLEKTLKFMAKFGDEESALKAWIAAIYELSIQGYMIVGDEKATRLNTAYIFIVLAFIFFFLSFLVRIIFS